MREYAVSIFVFSAMLGILSLLVYRAGEDRVSRFAFAVLLLYTVAAPLGTVIEEIGGGLDFESGDFSAEEFGDDYKKVAEDAFAEGIRRLICQEFSLSDSHVDVHISGFDFENMRAEKIKIILSPACAFADPGQIERLIDREGLGKCEVSFEV